MAKFLSISSFRKKKSAFIGNRDGVALIEFAFVAPILLLLIVGAMEYGIYFLKSMSSSRALSSASQIVMQNPTDPTNQTFANRPMSFGAHDVCAKAFPTLAAAEAGTCSGKQWNTAAPAGVPGAYYVTLQTRGTTQSITGLFSSFLPAINHKEVVKVQPNGGGGTTNESETASCPAGNALVSTGTGDVKCQPVQIACKTKSKSTFGKKIEIPVYDNGNEVKCSSNPSITYYPSCSNGKWICPSVFNPGSN